MNQLTAYDKNIIESEIRVGLDSLFYDNISVLYGKDTVELREFIYLALKGVLKDVYEIWGDEAPELITKVLKEKNKINKGEKE